VRLELLEGQYAVARFGADEDVPAGLDGEFVSVTRTAEELSVVGPSPQLEGDPLRALRVAGTLDHSLTGVLLSLAAPLAEAGVPIFAVSTFDTDYVLVPEGRLDDALGALRATGHEIDA
jgi:hypothetical protein